MGISEKDIKLLWSRSAGRCAICGIELSHSNEHSNNTVPIGEQAHIIGEKETAPRGTSILDEKQRNSYANLILLCPTCHTKIDKDEAGYPVELLHLRKTEHELFVKRTLSGIEDPKAKAGDIVYSALIDAAVEACQLKDWDEWIYDALPPLPRWTLASVELVSEFRRKVARAVWPKQKEELERSISTLSLFADHAQHMFHQNARQDTDGWLRSESFYKIRKFTQKEYDRRLAIYNEWEEAYHEAIIGLAKAANWFADMVRLHINPLFFALEGKFIISWSSMATGRTTDDLPELTEHEKATYPDGIQLRFVDVWARIGNK